MFRLQTFPLAARKKKKKATQKKKNFAKEVPPYFQKLMEDPEENWLSWEETILDGEWPNSVPKNVPSEKLTELHNALQLFLQQLPLSLFQKEELLTLINEEIDINLEVLGEGIVNLDEQKKHRYDILMNAAQLQGEIVGELRPQTWDLLTLRAPHVSSPKEITKVRKYLRNTLMKKIKKFEQDEMITYPKKLGAVEDNQKREYTHAPIPLKSKADLEQKKKISGGGLPGVAFYDNEVEMIAAALRGTSIDKLEDLKFHPAFLKWINEVAYSIRHPNIISSETKEKKSKGENPPKKQKKK